MGDNGADNVVIQIQPALEAKGTFVLEGSDRKDFDFSGKQVSLQSSGEGASGFAVLGPVQGGRHVHRVPTHSRPLHAGGLHLWVG